MKPTILALSAALAIAGCSDAQNREELTAELSVLRYDIESGIAGLKQEASAAKDLKRDIATETFIRTEDQQKEILDHFRS